MTRERRASPRLKVPLPLEARLRIEADTDVTALSLGGMAVRTEVPLGKDTIHDFTLGLGGETLSLRGAVRSCDPLPRERYLLGVEFEGLTPAQKSVLDAFLARKLRS